jgi:DNA-binding IclR family transcriptional regulator
VQYDRNSLTYKPGLRLFEFILLQSAVLDVRKEAEEFLIDLHNKTNQTVLMAVKESNDQIFYVYKKENDEGLKVSSLVGLHRPYLYGVLGPVILAYQPEHDIERILKMPIPQFTPYTVTDTTIIRQRLQKIKKEGFYVMSNETAIGVTGIGAPIFDINGDAIAAIGVVGPAIQLDNQIEETKRLLMDASAKISAKIGYRNSGR